MTSSLEDQLALITGKPSVVLLIGGTAKNRAISKLASPSPQVPRGDAVIRLRPQRNFRPNCPLFFADGPVPSLANFPCRLEDDRLAVRSAAAGDAILKLYSRVFTPLADVICVLADDFGQKSSELSSFLVRWKRLHSKPYHATFCPLLVIVTSSPLEREFKQEIRNIAQTVFGQVKFHNTADPLPLQSSIQSSCSLSRDARESRSLLFDKAHFNILFDRAYRSF
ncbi:hypothetical protein FDECE_99 [Fusarium decemcellulare]|nr:hypothetical protein FDECE_99 [Fusarium decemcellulare]